MERAEQRQAVRVECDVPLCLLIHGEWQDVTVVDVSRTGVRLRVPLETLGVDPDVGLADIAQHLDQVLPARAQARFHPERLGDLVSRTIKVVRLVLVEGDKIELGCVLDQSLGEIEAAAIGVPVPMAPPKRTVSVRTPNSEWTAPQGEAHTRHRFRAIVMPTGKGRVEPLMAYTDRVDDEGVIFTVPDVARLGLPEEGEDIRPRVVAFSEIYGPDVTLDVLAGTSTVFHGPASLVQVEAVPEEPNQLVVGFSFQRDLEESEQRALRLV